MVQWCAVPMCANNAKCPGISFFSFPRDEKVRKSWLIRIRRDERKCVEVSDSMRVCSAHFEEEDFILSSNGKRRLLQKGAIPSVFQFTSPRKLKKRRIIVKHEPQATTSTMEMPSRCSVPGCHSNYDSEPTRTSTFLFPKDEQQKEKWLSSIKREGFIPGPSASVCIKHFDERFIIREDQFGTFKKLRLVAGAYPTQFPNRPSYLSKKLPKVRKTPTEGRKEIKKRAKDILMKLCEKDKIKSLDDMKEILGEKLTDPWQYKTQEDSILIYKIEISHCPKVPVSFQVLSDLTVNVYHNNICLDTKSVLGFTLGPELKLDKWTKLDCVLSHLSSIQAKDIPIDQKLNAIRQILNEIIEADGGDVYSDKLKFISEQLMLAFSKQLRYNPDIILWCSKLYFQYPAAYSLLRNTELLTLPSPSRLRNTNGWCEQDK